MATAGGWQAPISDTRLGDAEVHVWRASLVASLPALAARYPMLSANERSRAARFLLAERAERFVAGRAILRELLSRYTGVPPLELVLRQSPTGKLLLAPRPDGLPVHFNASHSGDIALYAITTGRDVGVDVEAVRADRDGRAIAERTFSAGEREFLRRRWSADGPAAFYRLWTLKEAYLKATGDGLSRPLSSFEVRIGPGGEAALRWDRSTPRRPAGWTLRRLEPCEGYAGAVVVEGRGVRVRRFGWGTGSGTDED